MGDEKQAAIEAEQDAIKKVDEEAKAAIQAEKTRLASLTDEQRRGEIEKEKTNRQSTQAKELQKAADAREAEAIAAMKATADNEAKKVSQIRKIQEQAAEIARAK